MHKTPHQAQLSTPRRAQACPGAHRHAQARTGTPRRAQARPGAHSGRIVALGPAVSQPGPAVSQAPAAVSQAPAAVSQPHAARPRSPSSACSFAALRARLAHLCPRPALPRPACRRPERPAPHASAACACCAPVHAHARAPTALRAPAPCVPSACCAQQPSPSVAIQYFCIVIHFFFQPYPTAPVTIQKLYRDTLPSQPVSLQYDWTLLQYKPTNFNTLPIATHFTLRLQYNSTHLSLSCNTIFFLQYKWAVAHFNIFFSAQIFFFSL